MVQIVIKKAQCMEEWSMIELQGEIVSRHDNGFAGNKLGNLHFTKSGEPILIIGHHILHGKVTKLEKPFAVVEMLKTKTANDETPKEDEPEDVHKTYYIKAVITKRIIFKNRPKPIITNVPKRERVEESVLRKLKDFEDFSDLEPGLHLNRNDHIPYLQNGLRKLSTRYECLDASQPWLCYWIVHSLKLLDHELTSEEKTSVVGFLSKCQCPKGGYGGGQGQIAHLAPTYAAINCLCTLATEEAYNSINRETLLSFLFRLRQPNGSFVMHDGGEVDTRSLYCAVAVSSLTALDKLAGDSLFKDSAEWIVSCQTYEGGIGGCPGAEAHGGYTFCGYAGLLLLGHEKLVNTDRLLRWLVNKQMRLEGGFQGRTNKLVDGCYSFWQCGVFPLLRNTLMKEGNYEMDKHSWIFDQQALQEYVLISCQSRFGGLLDKPGKSPDYYHTCYCLSGLSIAQHSPDGSLLIMGERENKLLTTHPVYNVEWEAVNKALKHFQSIPLNTIQEKLKCTSPPS